MGIVTKVVDIKPLAERKNLQRLNLSGTQADGWQPLSKAKWMVFFLKQ